MTNGFKTIVPKIIKKKRGDKPALQIPPKEEDGGDNNLLLPGRSGSKRYKNFLILLYFLQALFEAWVKNICSRCSS